MTSRNFKSLLVIILIFAVAGFGLYYLVVKDRLAREDINETPIVVIPDTDENDDNIDDAPEPFVLASDLNIPWEIAYIEEEGFLVTERPGNLVRLKDGNKRFIPVDEVNHFGEGGLMGLALHPNFSENRYIYLYLTTESGIRVINKVERYRYDLERNELSEKTLIIGDIPGSRNHDGGRLAFGPDGFLYITTGDAGNANLAQDRNSLAGKILRVRDDGSVPDDNPFGSPVWTYGHRNSQGLAWDGQGRLWATEHGRSGVSSGYDELNLIERGKNYGWPEIQGDETREGMEKPVIHSGASTTWAPAGLGYLGGRLFFTGLKGEALYSVLVGEDGGVSDFKTHYQDVFGRLRAVLVADGDLYISTSNRDGRGSVSDGDDMIIRVPLETIFKEHAKNVIQ